MATATRDPNAPVLDGDGLIVPGADEPQKKTRAPALKRPDGLSDTEWEIMKSARNEDVHKRINEIMAGDGEVSAEEAAVLLEVVVGAERQAIQAIIRLRKGIQPKVEKLAVSAQSLGDIKMRLFRLATGR